MITARHPLPGRTGLALLLPMLVAACASPLAAIDGGRALERQVEDYYGDRAMEANATCPSPRIDAITGATPVAPTGNQQLVQVRYHWTDDSQSVDLGNGGSLSTCTGWGERTFTLERRADGTATVIGMTGLQKRA